MQEAERSSGAPDFGKLLRHFRLAAGLSQEALAERAHMSAFAISALERGHRRKPQSKTLALLADALALDSEQRAQFETAARSAPPRLGAVTVGPWAGETALVANNLPRQVTPLIGRDDELTKIESLVRTHALTTLVGAGGIGKTRLALRVGEALLEGSGDGVWLVELAAFNESATVQAIASTFGLGEQQGRSLPDVVLDYLQLRRLVLILDNCEHVIDEAARVVDAILQRAPNIRMLATSREALHVGGEHVYRVPALAVPPNKTLSAEEAARYGAVALFAERAEAVDAAFRLTDDIAPVVADVCTRLDGIPLAIELAAARTSLLSVPEIAARLDQRFSVLTTGRRTSIPRQQTLRALIDWSYDLLSESERTLFRTLGVFSGGFSLDSAAAVCGQGREDRAFDLLASLVEKSLVHAETIEGTTRYRLLESTRAYAHEQLIANGDLDAAALSHGRAYLALAEQLESEWDATPDVEWKTNAEPELENWRAALRWSFGPGGDLSIGRQLVVALRPVWFTLAPAEGLVWVRAGLDSCDVSRPDRVRAWLDVSAAHLAMLTQQYGNAAASAQRALADFSTLDDKQGSALARLFAGAARGMLGETKEAEADLRAALEECRALGKRRSVAAALIYLAAFELETGDADSARSLFAEALTLFKSLGASRPAAHVALNLAELEFKGGNAVEALRLANDALEAERALNDPDAVAYDLCNLAVYEGALCRWDASVSHARDALALARERGMTSAVAWAMQHLAAVAALRPVSDASLAIQQRRRAARLVGFVDTRVAEHGLHRDFTEQGEHEQILAVVRETLGTESDALIEEGRNWTEARAFEESLLI
jgi:predicted ATPase/DNA-binding XRE family transcriptional regulator